MRPLWVAKDGRLFLERWSPCPAGQRLSRGSGGTVARPAQMHEVILRYNPLTQARSVSMLPQLSEFWIVSQAAAATLTERGFNARVPRLVRPAGVATELPLGRSCIERYWNPCWPTLRSRPCPRPASLCSTRVCQCCHAIGAAGLFMAPVAGERQPFTGDSWVDDDALEAA